MEIEIVSCIHISLSGTYNNKMQVKSNVDALM